MPVHGSEAAEERHGGPAKAADGQHQLTVNVRQLGDEAFNRTIH